MTMTPLTARPTRDTDPEETAEWVEALESLTRVEGPERAHFVLSRVTEEARRLGVTTSGLPYSAYRNTIPPARQPAFPGDLAMEERITSIIRWNALAMVVRANRAHGELGGHIATLRFGRGDLRGRLQPFLPGRSAVSLGRPRLLPAAFRAGRLCPRLS